MFAGPVLEEGMINTFTPAASGQAQSTSGHLTSLSGNSIWNERYEGAIDWPSLVRKLGLVAVTPRTGGSQVLPPCQRLPALYHHIACAAVLRLCSDFANTFVVF